MSKCTEIRDICGDYAFDVEYSADNKFTLFFNSRRNAETVKRCIEVDDSVPNVATAVDFVEVVRCKNCKQGYKRVKESTSFNFYWCGRWNNIMREYDFCSFGERRD